MATFKKSHSRSKPIVETPHISPGKTWVEKQQRYTASLCLPGGPPYIYYELQLSESEMLSLATAWLTQFASDRAREVRNQSGDV